MTNERNSDQKSREQRIHDAYSQMGKKGGEARKQQLGHDGYVEMGHMGGEARKEQMARGEITRQDKSESGKEEE